jgi:hypothetical protein
LSSVRYVTRGIKFSVETRLAAFPAAAQRRWDKPGLYSQKKIAV